MYDLSGRVMGPRHRGQGRKIRLQEYIRIGFDGGHDTV